MAMFLVFKLYKLKGKNMICDVIKNQQKCKKFKELDALIISLLNYRKNRKYAINYILRNRV